MCRAAWGGGGNSPQPGAPSPQEEPCQHAAVAAGPQCSLPVLQGWELAEEMGGGGLHKPWWVLHPKFQWVLQLKLQCVPQPKFQWISPRVGCPIAIPLPIHLPHVSGSPAALPTCVEKRPWPSHPNCSSLEWGAKAPSANVRTPQPLLCLIQPGS